MDVTHIDQWAHLNPCDVNADVDPSVQFYAPRVEHNPARTRREPNFIAELSKYGFDEDVMIKADDIFTKIGRPSKRNRARLQCMWYCTYNAKLELYTKCTERRPIFPIELGIIFGLTSGEVHQAKSMFSPIQTGYRPPRIDSRLHICSYVYDYCLSCGLSTSVSKAAGDMASDIMNKSPSLLEQNPQAIAAGLVKYYLTVNGIRLTDEQILIKISGRSNATIENNHKLVAQADNQ